MSMMTRCPTCGTAFRVTEQQLAIRDGQVRCGRCDTLFDAIASLSSDPVTRPPREKPSPPTSGSMAVLLGTEKDRSFDFGPPESRPASRLWLLGTLLLVIALAAQGAYRYRGEVSVLVPEAKPLLERMCAELGCDVPLPRRVELLSIETSDLQAEGSHPSVMVLTATLRNRAAFVQAYPALELSLTSAQGETVARRVLMPKDYVAPPARSDAGFASGSELQIKVFIEAAALKPTGYRLYLFYA
ncbi:MAG TPA: DUF3426 domain-containing protein [Burkholderiales bacterium]|nr:DUF3426 domain-containing protein [Burkholderiales bacterium]